eukprot:CAMPEP_0194574104 /NCGR_PEP_ID=MMETSP0292-20121207/10093_1 /TAXON_ID=39354 /ORGANISM="Heterosigma akashiwo, Strain CCMP2393" /LENGTH=523 /DNA_ID=CAMNT_0039425567 /DNA_START=175 /DNA_END=1743 /DNA_ORIENTATION=+
MEDKNTAGQLKKDLESKDQEKENDEIDQAKIEQESKDLDNLFDKLVEENQDENKGTNGQGEGKDSNNPRDEDEEDDEDDEEDEEDEEFLAQVEALKTQGNEAFKNKDYDTAINFYSQAISIDPDNHLLYSNRSAAYLAEGNSKSKALKDAEKCVALAPDFVKGYSRLGAAQHALRRYQAAYDTYRAGLELDRANTALSAALGVARKALDEDRRTRWRQGEEERFHQAERSAADTAAQSALRRAQAIEDRQQEEGDGGDGADPEAALLGDFFAGLQAKKPERKVIKQAVAQEKYLKAPLGTAKEQVERILATNYKFKNLNSFYVLDLEIDANEEDFKQRYRKLATLIHPDKNLDLEGAREAFEEIKTAYQNLTDEKIRKQTILTIETATKNVLRERARLLQKGATVEQLGDENEQLQKQTMKDFAEIEMRRRQSERLKQAYKAREQHEEAEEKRKEKEQMEFDKKWSTEDRRDKRMGNWMEYAKDSKRSKVAKMARTAMWKEETRAEEKKKFGQVKLEEWKKKW